MMNNLLGNTKLLLPMKNNLSSDNSSIILIEEWALLKISSWWNKLKELECDKSINSLYD